MSEKINFDYKKLHPFKWYILENFPFLEDSIDALTNYQLFCKLGKMYNKQVDAINTLGVQVEGLTDWFDNLDVQDEINNKLDEMAESGELTEIIADYLNTKALICFDTVSDMKQAENLVSGSFAKTLGYHSINDGGAATYKIVEDIPSGYYETLDSGLYAELIFENNEINIKQFGCKCDGITNDTLALQNAINQLNNNGITKYTLLIPGISIITSRLQFSETGTTLKGYNINKCGFKLQGVNSYIEFGGVNSVTYEINIKDMMIHGDYTQDQVLLFNKCYNIYLNRVYLSQAGQNKHLIKYINGSGMTWIKECIIDSSEDVENYPGYCNGIYFDKMDSIFDMEGCNLWNLNKVLDFRDTTLQVNIHNNWMECCRQLFYHTNATDLRYMNLNIQNNTLSIHSYANFNPGTTSIVKIDGTENTNGYNSYIKLINNNIYLYNDITLDNNSLINITNLLSGGTIYIVYENNVISGKNLEQLSGYVCYLNSNVTNKVKFVQVSVNSRIESSRLTNVKTAIICGMINETSSQITYCFPNGVYLTKQDQLYAGNIYYDNGHFYAGYNGTNKKLPERVGTAIPYATSSTNLVDYLNTLTTALVNSGIIDRQT